MALTTDITLNPQNYGGANVSTAFAFVTEKDSKSIRRVTATALTTPNTLTVQHQVRKVNAQKGSTDLNSHQVRIDLTAVDTNLGLVTANVWTVLNLPAGQTAITAVHIKDMFGQISALLCTAGVMDKILAGES